MLYGLPCWLVAKLTAACPAVEPPVVVVVVVPVYDVSTPGNEA